MHQKHLVRWNGSVRIAGCLLNSYLQHLSGPSSEEPLYIIYYYHVENMAARCTAQIYILLTLGSVFIAQPHFTSHLRGMNITAPSAVTYYARQIFL